MNRYWRLTVLLFCCGSAPAAAGENSPELFGCVAIDATACWQAAIDNATPAGRAPYFGSVLGTAGAAYIIRHTLIIQSAVGGTIDGNGSMLEWQGPPDQPMFLVKNTQQVRFVNLRILAVTPLESAFEFTKAPYGKDQALNVSPSANVIDSVRIEGIKLGNLRYGVRFSKRYGIDEDNDQSTIMNTVIYNVTEAAISIEHSQSQHHHFYAVKAGGAEGNLNAAFVRAAGGSFSSLGGFHGGFRGAVYDISSVYGTDLIVDENSEGSARLLRTPAGAASFPFPVHIIGGRFAVNRVSHDGKLIDFNRMGPLSIDGLTVDGLAPPSAVKPVISFLPDPVNGKGQGSLTVTNLAFAVGGSGSWDILNVNGATRLTTRGNSCADGAGNLVSCRGLANGVSYRGGVTFKDMTASPYQDLAAGHSVFCADCAADKLLGTCIGGGAGRIAIKLRSGWSCS